MKTMTFKYWQFKRKVSRLLAGKKYNLEIEERGSILIRI